MNKALKDRLIYWLRQASDQGRDGFFYDYIDENEEQNEDWLYFEKMAIEDIDNFLSNFGQGDF